MSVITTPSIAQMAWSPPEPGPTYVRLLAALVAADVDAVGENARGRLQDGPGVARGRDLLELGLVTVAPVEIRRSSSSGVSAVTVITSSTAAESVSSIVGVATDVDR